MAATSDTIDHRTAFARLDDVLTLRRAELRGEDGTDIRARVLSLRDQPWAIGYGVFNLDRAYAANMQAFWPRLISFEEPAAKAATHRMLMGMIFADPGHSHAGSLALMQQYRQGQQLIFGEQGFLASSHSWSESFRRQDPQLSCLGYVYDDIAFYYMADYPNRLIHRLNSDHAPDSAEIARARTLIDRIVAGRISKYNSQPLVPPAMTRGYRRRVLVVDQTYADASTVYGRIDAAGFEAMLLAAITENPDAEILVKTHPDATWEPDKRRGYYSHLADAGRVRILRNPINPYMLFDQVDTVYVGTSQLGIEALFAGKKVVTFGAPFYAGWGLTDDRQDIPHRHRTRSLEELFHYFYVWYTIYHVPGASAVPSQIEEVLDYIEASRPVSLPVPKVAASAQPRVSVIIPVYDVEPYIEDCLRSVQAQTLTEIEIITVNDRSPDQSQAIIDRLAAEDPRICPVVLERNMGQGFARNVGLEAARGDYVWFLDSDDFMPSPDHLARVHACALEDGADMVRGRKLFEQVEDAGGNIVEMRRDRCEIHFDRPIHGVTLAECPRILRSRHFCNWLYRRAFLEEGNIRFLTAQWEERPFLLRALLSARAISATPSEAFVYRIRPDSTARRPKTPRDSFNQLANFEQVSEVLAEFDAYAPGSPLRYTAGFMIMQALHILFYGFAWRSVKTKGSEADRQRFLDRVSAVIEASGLRFDDMVFDAPQLLRARLGTHAYRLLFEALRQRRHDHVGIALEERALDQAEVMATLLVEPDDADAADWAAALSLYARNERVRTAPAVTPVAQKPRLVIHVGQTKTGSTYIQHFLEQNRPALLRAGVLVPDVGLFWQPNRPHKQAGHASVTAEAASGGHAIRDHVEAALGLAEGRIHTVILSSEAYFLNRRSALIPDHFRGYDAQMIGYFRRQDDWANSQYAEFVAGGAMGRVACSFEEWLDLPETRERLDYFSYCQLWAAQIGPDNVQARLYDRARLKDGDVVSDFLAALDLEELAELPRPDLGKANDMPFSTPHVMLLREINGHAWPDQPAYLDFIQEAGERIGALRDGPGRVQLAGWAVRRRLMSDLAASNADFAATFCPAAASGFALPEDDPPGHGDGADARLGTAEIAALYSSLEGYDPGPKPSPAVIRHERPLTRPDKPDPVTPEEIRAMTGLVLDMRALPETVRPGAAFGAEVTLFNLSAHRIPLSFDGAILKLSYHIFDAEGGRVIWNGLRHSLTRPVDHQYRVTLSVIAPDAPGLYQFQPGLVVEGQRWFESTRKWHFEVT